MKRVERVVRSEVRRGWRVGRQEEVRPRVISRLEMVG